MTYKEYSQKIAEYRAWQSKRKSLLMTLRMNKAWDINAKNSKKYIKRQQIIEAAQKELGALAMLPKPIQPIGYQVLVNGDYNGFIAKDDYKAAFDEAQDFLGHTNFTLKTKPRFSD